MICPARRMGGLENSVHWKRRVGTGLALQHAHVMDDWDLSIFVEIKPGAIREFPFHELGR